MSKRIKILKNVRVEEEKAQYNGANVLMNKLFIGKKKSVVSFRKMIKNSSLKLMASKKVQQKIWTKPLKQLFVNGI